MERMVRKKLFSLIDCLIYDIKSNIPNKSFTTTKYLNDFKYELKKAYNKNGLMARNKKNDLFGIEYFEYISVVGRIYIFLNVA